MADTTTETGKTTESKAENLGEATAKDLAMEQITAAITSGDLRAEPAKVEAEDKASKRRGYKGYTRYVALTAKGMAVLCGGKIAPQTPKPAEGDDTRSDVEKQAGAADYFNYGYDLEERARVRGQVLSALEGPEKAIAKAVAVLVANGIPEASARAIVVKGRTDAGLAV